MIQGGKCHRPSLLLAVQLQLGDRREVGQPVEQLAQVLDWDLHAARAGLA